MSLKQFIVLWFVSTLVLVLLDAVWLPLTYEKVYKPVYQEIQGGQQNPVKLRMEYGVVAWIVLGFAVASHISHVDHKKKSQTSLLKVFTMGATTGFTIYAVYNFTNLATFKDYTLSLAIKDTLWGTFAIGVTSVCVSHLSSGVLK